MDCIGDTVKADRDNRPNPVLDIFPDLAKRLIGTPRYLLDDAATRTAVELSLGRPKILHEALRHLRIPFPRLWVEWDDSAREALRVKFANETQQYAELRPMPGRVGFLVECDDNGRRGHATWLWTTPTVIGNVPNVGVVEPYFDLDRPVHQPPEGLTLAKLWKDNPVQHSALLDIWRYVNHAPSPWGEVVLAAGGHNPLHKALAYSDVTGEWIMLLMILLLLTADRPVIDLVKVDLGKLNKRRMQKKDAVPLLDHTQVSLKLNPTEPRYKPVVRGPLGHKRLSPRIHWVSSYLTTRGGRNRVIMPYMRGKGTVIHRRVTVRG